MIRQKHSKNSPHFNKQRIDLWALKKTVDGLSVNQSRLLRRIEQLQTLIDTQDEEIADLRSLVVELQGGKKGFWQKVKRFFAEQGETEF